MGERGVRSVFPVSRPRGHTNSSSGRRESAGRAHSLSPSRAPPAPLHACTLAYPFYVAAAA